MSTAEVFAEILDELRALEAKLVAHPEMGADEQSRCEAYRWLFSITQVALDCFVWADSSAPRFVDIVGTTKKWGGDNADAFYQHAPIDPTRRYRVSGDRGDAVYLSLTVYAGPDDGHYSERIVGSLNDRDLTFADDGTFEFWVAPAPVDDGPGIVLDADSVVAITRDYLPDPSRGRRTSWRIEALDPAPPYRLTDADLSARMTKALTWIRDQAAIVPVPVFGEPNTIEPPYPVPTTTFGWAAGDAAYAMGSFDLEPGQRLEISGRSPECAFWNLCLWNPLLHTYNYDRGRVTINGDQAVYEPDGSWTVVVSDEDPGHPNWVSTQGHRSGRIWLRWFLPAETPEPLTCRVVSS
ncbi:MAG: DUF1214 domain-containing protein [Acidimicrobiales bacterium]